MHKLIKLDVFGRQVLAVRSEEGWQLFYIGGDGKRRSVDDLIVPSLLVEKGLEKIRQKDYPAVVVLGHPDYYPRFGFVSSQKYNITSEYDVPPEVFMIKELQPGILAGKSGIASLYSRLIIWIV
jgi:hypothetical protein